MSALGETWRRLRAHRGALAGLAVLGALAVTGALAPVLTPHDPLQQRLAAAFLPMSAEHPLGTDQLGRDMLARILYGTRYSLFTGTGAVAVALLVGVPLGLVSGYFGGWTDLVLQRFVDVLLAFPFFLLALALVAVLGVGLGNVVLSVGISAVPPFVRLVRVSALELRTRAFVEAAHGVGAGHARILWRHLLPNSLAPVIVQASVSVGFALIVAAGLGFLGLGVQPPTPEWGAMLGEGRQYIFAKSELATFPGLAIFATVLAFNLLGDGLRDALDPRLRMA